MYSYEQINAFVPATIQQKGDANKYEVSSASFDNRQTFLCDHPRKMIYNLEDDKLLLPHDLSLHISVYHTPKDPGKLKNIYSFLLMLFKLYLS